MQVVANYRYQLEREREINKDLLEALQIAGKAMEQGRNVTFSELKVAIDMARVAIRKALGED
ncbi:hypothetical protein HEC60_23690 [Yokenella regensburgei]|nr:hypothetical protein HEC60_23690 [Yokenella regensburgei]